MAAGVLLVVAASLGAALWPAPGRAAVSMVNIYTYEGRTNVLRKGKVLETKIDMPMEKGDLVRIEKDSWVDFAFFYSVGMRVFGPCDVVAKNIASVSGLEVRVSAGRILLHTGNSGDDFQFTIETPLAVVTNNEPVLAEVVIEPAVKGDPSSGRTQVIVKKGVLDVTAKLSGTGVRMLENQRVVITPETFSPAATGVQGEEMRPAEQARSVFLPEREEGSEAF